MLNQTLRDKLVISFIVICVGISSALSQGQRSTRLLERYTGTIWDDELARLDFARDELHAHSDNKIAIVIYGNPTTVRSDLACRKDYFISSRGVDSDKILTINGGARDQYMVELWLVPQNAVPPATMPYADVNQPKYIFGYLDYSSEFACSSNQILNDFTAELKSRPNVYGALNVGERNRRSRSMLFFARNQILKSGISPERLTLSYSGKTPGYLELILISSANSKSINNF